MSLSVQKDFFISYTSADARWAEWIAWQLEEAGYSVILQAWDFRPGANFVAEMDRAISNVKRTLAVLSPQYLNALYTQPEKHAQEQDEVVHAVKGWLETHSHWLLVMEDVQDPEMIKGVHALSQSGHTLVDDASTIRVAPFPTHRNGQDETSRADAPATVSTQCWGNTEKYSETDASGN